MAVTLDSLCGTTSLPLGRTAYYIGQGLTPSSTYNMAYDDGPPFDVGNDISYSGSLTADANGDISFGVANALAFNQPVYIHTGALLTQASRISASYTITWTGTGAQPLYGTGAVLDTATPGDTTVDLSWTAAFGCDARLVSIVYQVQRSTTGPSSGFSNVGAPQTGTTYHDTGRTNGTTYWYRIITTITYIASLVMPTFTSNSLSAVPSAFREYWGHIVQP